MNILKNSNKIILSASFLVFLYTIFLLISNASSGFDITDESFYILSAQHQGEIYDVVRRDGYYTGILYYLSGQNLSYHRLFGILLLVGISIWFGIELYRYIAKKFDYSMTVWDKLSFVIPIMTGGLVYYRYWLITPSYNWLALVSVILVLISLLRIVTNKEQNYDRYITLDYLILSFSLNLAFMAKPTTALMLAAISLIFLIFEFKNINFKKALPSVIILTTIIVIGHIVFLDNGFNSYYDRLTESLERFSVADSRYTLSDRVVAAYELVKAFFFENFYFQQIDSIYIFAFISIIIILYALHFKKNVLKIYTIFLYGVFLAYSYFLFKYGLHSDFRLLWFRTIELLFLSIIFVFISILFAGQKKAYFINNMKAISLVTVLVLGSFAYSFGTNGNILHNMSGSLILVIAAIIVVNYLLDKILDTTIFVQTAGFLLSLCVLFTIQNAYKHPYRLIEPINEQVHYIDLLGGLQVDNQQKAYIQDLQKITAHNRMKDETISLIDMTGGSPGANVILEASFFGESWLGTSNAFVKRVLNPYRETDRLKNAWILVAPKGKMKYILCYLKLNFLIL